MSPCFMSPCFMRLGRQRRMGCRGGLGWLGLGSGKPGTALGARSRAIQSHSFHNIIMT